jgi:hypothetical protein
MNNTNTQPDAGSQEADSTPVANNLGKVDEYSLADFVKSNFLNEEEAAPAKEEQQAEPEVETEETAEAEPEVEAEVEADQSTDEEGEPESPLSRGVQKRINKLVAAKKAAQAKLQEQEQRLISMQQELEATRASIPAVKQDINNSFENVNSAQELEKHFKQAVDVIVWCEQNPDGGEIPMPNGEMLEVTSKQVQSMKSAAIKHKDLEIPVRYQYLQQQQMAEPLILQDFPWYKKPESQEYQAAMAIARDFPEIKRRPDWKHLAGIVVEGLKAYTDRKSKPTSTAPIKRAPSQPAPKAAPSASKDDTKTAQKSFLKDPSSRDGLSDLVKAMGFV